LIKNPSDQLLIKRKKLFIKRYKNMEFRRFQA